MSHPFHGVVSTRPAGAVEQEKNHYFSNAKNRRRVITKIATTMKKLALLLILGFINSCRSPEPESVLVGSWAWEKSVGGFTGADVISGTDRRIDTFTNRGTYESKLDGALRMTADYTFKPSGFSGPGAFPYTLLLTNITVYQPGKSVARLDSLSYIVSTINQQQLSYFDAGWSDGYSHLFQRR